MESDTPPTTTELTIELQNQIGLNYQQYIGKLIFLVITCHPDI